MSYEKIKEYVEDHSFNFLGSKASLKDLETFEYVYEKVIDAIDKQIKANTVTKKHYDTGYYRCPNCGESNIHNRYKYCFECGQKLNWG